VIDNQAVARRYLEEFWNQDQADVADELYTADHAYHDPNLPDLPLGPEGVKERGRIYKEAVPGRVTEIREWVGDGDTVVCFWTYVGKNTGPLGDIAATNREAVIPGMHLWHFREGRISESWVMWDRLGLLEQLGLAG
jgi:predicted ester cyclase